MVDRGLRAGSCGTGHAGGAQENSSGRSKKTRGPVARPPRFPSQPPPRTPSVTPRQRDFTNRPAEARIPSSEPCRTAAHPALARHPRAVRGEVLFNCSPCSNFSSIAIRSSPRESLLPTCPSPRSSHAPPRDVVAGTACRPSRRVRARPGRGARRKPGAGRRAA
ncbi:conserved hypothetical protein [Streptomyces sviceus ATCC 29083]|uniref:Uncharacterized protein n=1 Tax=Streptomyces sviceus (strain ATCC 29083 / DSM 924 / JCM 4929 / NBRC 13980 / NCIMB 11184 / NRRL 5439 / UC 5370) TaxID=463191 RepID=B5HYZ9_STRX2|nr:conserved hypothetical protein [Streptomyces sviceus ATCC 29083]